MAQEFKIGRLRFEWSGVWTPNTSYARDDIVSYQGKTYVCLIANTSDVTNFYNDLNHITGLGASTPYWNLIIEGKTFTGQWSTGTAYSLGNITIFGGQLYYCTTQHTSTTFASQSTYWSLYTQFPNWHISWTTTTVYGIGDVVKYGGIVYSCITNHTSAATTALGLEANQSSWKVFYSGVEYKGIWTAATRYKVNDLVKQGDNIYQCITFNSDSSFTPSNWSLWMPGLEYAPVNPWSAGAIYQVGDEITYGGYSYISKTTNNTGNNPSTATANWSLFTQGFAFSGEWNISTSYIVGNMVRRHGMLYSANANSTGQDPAAFSIATTYTLAGSSGTTLIVGSGAGIQPGMYVLGTGFTQGQTVVNVSGTTVILSGPPDSTVTLVNGQSLNFVGINYAYWNLLVPGTYWTKTWINGTVYTVGDIASWQNTTYVCIQSHTASLNSGIGQTINRPDLDTTNTYWIIYVTHARKNAMNTVGDLEYYSKTSSSYTALPIGTNSYTLRSTSSTPTWSNINTITNVYYVCSSTGKDSAGYGNTWDRPYKSIAYTCNLINAGTQNPNTVALIVANKSWILAEMVQWANYQITNNISPYTSSYAFDPVKAARDAGYIIDALAYDLGRGGNSQIVAAALAFFAYNQNNVFYNSAVAADVPYYLPMLNYLTSLINYAVIQQTPSPTASYQILNSITPVIYQTTGLANAEPAITAGGIISTLVGYVTTALSTQSTYSLPTPNTGVSITIFVKTGTYSETLPISVPENTAIVGDELRGVVVQPAINIIATTTASDAVKNVFTVSSVVSMADQMPVMFANPIIQNVIGTTYAGFGGITTGQKYYIVGSTINATANQFGITGCTGTYTYVTATSVSSVGSNATFTVSPLSTGKYSVSVSYAGAGYGGGDTLRILGGNIGAPVIAATAMTLGLTYTIFTVGGTSYVAGGAGSNTVGTSFVYNGATLTGTGTVNLSINDINITVGNISGGGLTGPISTITVSSTSSTIVQLSAYSGGNMTVYAGDSLKDMFRLRNGTGLRNMTLVGLAGTLGGIDSFLIQRPTGGSYACLDPGINPNDTTAWIFRRSPYVQNVTAFGNGCTGLKIDGTLHNGGNKSIVCNDFTHIINDGIGIWCTGPGSLTEAVSVFSYYGYAGYYAEAGGRIRATNGNSSYGTYGVIAAGYDSTETPATGIVFNQSTQIQASVQSSYGSNAQLLRLTFANAGSAYTTPTTNMINYSNNFLGASWVSDGNMTFAKNTLALTGNSEAWTLQGLTSGPDGSYVYQNIAIPAAGATYTNVSAVNVSGSGSAATFNITVTSTSYTVTVNSGGTGYVAGNQLFVAGGQLGGVNSVHDCIITVFSLSGSSILTVTATGTVPTNSALSYTCSLYVKQGTATSIDLYGIFSGSATATSSINYNFVTGLVTPSRANSGFLPTQYGAISQAISTTGNTVGWYRIWFALNDVTGLNTQLQFRIYPRGYSGTSGQYTYVYGAQVELSKSTYTPNFYLEVAATSKYTAYANLNITGAGTGVVTVADETRSAGIFQTYVTTDSAGITGGAGYLTASNNAQSGTSQFIQLATADTNTNANYTGMRVFINSGTGAGQYGYISYFDSRTTGLTPKYAWVLKESFTSLQIASTNQGTNLFTLNASATNVSTLYLNQPVQFIPTYYTTTVSSTNLSKTTVTSANGGTNNYFTCSSTVGLAINTAVSFTAGVGQAIFSNVTTGYTYYISAILSSTTFQISANYAGTVYQLNTVATGTMIMNFSANNNYLQAGTTNMVVNYPVQFTGTALGGVVDSTVYYISDVIDSGNFTISTTLITITVSTTTSGTNALTVSSVGGTGALIPLNPIVFTGVFDNIVDSQKYYISNIINSTQFNIASSLISVSMSATTTGTNLITVTSTTGFIANQPINFIGTTWEPNIISGTVYYVLAINNATTFTVSQTPGGGAVTMNGGAGVMTARTCGTSFTLSGSSGTMIGSSTNAVKTLTLSVTGAMTATFSTSLFGNVVIGQTYYVQSIPSSTGTTFAVSASTGTVSGTSTSATPFGLLTKTGSMNIAAVGWDHINPGTPILSVLDNTSVYFIEPRLIYSPPAFQQSTYTSAVALQGGASYSAMGYGGNYWIALPSLGQTGAGSADGQTWSSIALPSSNAWTGIAYGNGYWVAIATASNLAFVSKSGGLGWRSFALPSTNTWSKIAYGNGIFVIIANGIGNNATAYSTDYGVTWTASYVSSTRVFTATGNARLSTTQVKIGSTSLYLDGTTNTYVSSPSSTDYTLGTGDFTIEGWFYRIGNAGANQILIDLRPTGSPSVSPTVYLNTTYVPVFYVNGSVVITGSSPVPPTTWTHIAVSRTSGSTTLWVNGTQSGSTYSDSNNYIQGPITIGANQTGASLFTGYHDELRISKNIGRYTTTFTPSTTAFISDPYTLALLHLDGPNLSTSITSADGSANWSNVTYGNGTFVAVSNNGTPVTTSNFVSGAQAPVGLTTYNTMVVSSTTNIANGQYAYGTGLPVNTTVTNVNTGTNTITFSNPFTAQGAGTYVFFSATSNVSAYSTNGSVWTISTMPSSTNWSSIAFGQQTFVAVSSTSSVPAYSTNGFTWYSSNIAITSTVVTYGQGVFTALNSGSTVAYTSEDCLQWDRQTVASQPYGSATAFGITSTYFGVIPTLTGSSSGSIISAGCRTKGRASVSSGIISSISEWEVGSGLVTSSLGGSFSSATLIVTDPNVTTNVQVTARIGNGALSSPTFINRGNGYNSSSTVVLVSGAGYADQYQTGLTVILNNLSRLPSPGDNLTITGVSQIYKITSAYPVFGTTAPNYEANVAVSPAISVANATANGTVVSIRTKYSQARLTNHDFLYIGSGDLPNSQYPLTSNANSYPNNQTVEANYGRVFYTSTDQDGNFKVGSLFGVQQATGIVTLSASQFGLSGLSTLSLGGISVGGSSVVIQQFSTDSTFSSNSDAVIPTQKAIKTYLTSRLSQGGANTFTGVLTAGTVVVGGPNFIRSTIPNGTTGSNVKMPQKIYFGQVPGLGLVNIGVDGNMAALGFFARNAFRRS